MRELENLYAAPETAKLFLSPPRRTRRGAEKDALLVLENKARRKFRRASSAIEIRFYGRSSLFMSRLSIRYMDSITAESKFAISLLISNLVYHSGWCRWFTIIGEMFELIQLLLSLIV